MFKKHLVSPLRQLRKAKKISVRDLSDRIGIPEFIISRIERGEQMPDFKQSQRFGTYFDLPWPLVMERCYEHTEKIKNYELIYQKLSESTDDIKKVEVLCSSK